MKNSSLNSVPFAKFSIQLSRKSNSDRSITPASKSMGISNANIIAVVPKITVVGLRAKRRSGEGGIPFKIAGRAQWRDEDDDAIKKNAFDHLRIVFLRIICAQ